MMSHEHRFVLPKDSLVLGFILLIGIGLFSLLVQVQQIGTAFLNIYYGNVTGGHQLEGLTPPWWSPVFLGLLNYGDSLTSINGQPFVMVDEVTQQAFDRGERQATLTIVRDDVPQQVVIDIIPIDWVHIVDLYLPNSLIGLAYGLSGWLLFRSKRSADPRFTLVVRLLTLCAILMGSMYLLLVVEIHRAALGLYSPTENLRAVMVSTGSAVLVQLAFAVSTLDKGRFAHFVSRIVLISPIALLMMNVVMRVAYLATDGQVPAIFRMISGFVFNYLCILLPLALTLSRLVWFLVVVRKDVRYIKERQIAVTLLVGLMIALPAFILPSIGYSLTRSIPLFFQFLDLRFLALAIPILMTRSIARHQVINSRSPLLIIVPIIASSGIGASVINALFFLLQPRVFQFPVLTPYATSFLVLTAVSLFWAYHSRIDGWFGRLLNRDRSMLRDTRLFAERLTRVYEPPINAYETIIRAVREQYHVGYATLWVLQSSSTIDNEGAHYSRVNCSTAGLDETVWLNKRDQARIVHSKSPVHFQMIEESKPFLVFRQSPEAEIAVPLVYESRLFGVLLVGNPINRAGFDYDDVEVFATFAPYIVLFLELSRRADNEAMIMYYVHTMLLHEQMQAESALQKAISDLEEIRPQITAMLQNVWIGVKQSVRIMQRMVDGTVRYGFEDIPSMISSFEKVNAFTILMQLSEARDIPIVVQHDIYLLLKEALNNVAKHAQADLVNIVLEQHGNALHLEIRDNGIGLPSEKSDKKARQHRGGMEWMRKFVAKHGGTFVCRRANPHGTEIIIDMLVSTNSAARP